MAATLALTTKFNLDTGKFNFVDTSNYAAQGSPDLGIRGALRITGPSGLVYANADFATPVSGTPDITTAGSYLNNSITMPVDASGDIQQGEYTIEYNAYVTSGTDAGQTLTFTSTFDYTFEEPEIEITQTVNCFSATFTSTDGTSYAVDGITPTTTISHTVVEVADPSRTNTTNTNTTNTVVFPNLYAGDYKTTISTLAVYSFTGFTVSVTLTGNSTYEVACSSVANIYCGIQDVWEAYETAKENGDIKQAETSRSLFLTLMGLYQLYALAVNQEEDDDANTYLARIQELGGFTSSCSSTSGQIIPFQVRGDVYKTTSTSNISIGFGIKTFAVPNNLSYQPGVTTRATDAANPSNYVEGPIATYTGTSLGLSSINFGGSGTKSSWNINIGS
jgi:hypothetical protein